MAKTLLIHPDVYADFMAKHGTKQVANDQRIYTPLGIRVQVSHAVPKLTKSGRWIFPDWGPFVEWEQSDRYWAEPLGIGCPEMVPCVIMMDDVSFGLRLLDIAGLAVVIT
jgi:hypothetical protein